MQVWRSLVSTGDEGLVTMHAHKLWLFLSDFASPRLCVPTNLQIFPLSSFDVIPLPHVLSLLPVKLHHSSSLSLILTATLRNFHMSVNLRSSSNPQPRV
jgi:hypothetical protein